MVPEEWAAWRWFVLRGAGFPAATVLELAEPECVAAAARLIEAENAVQRGFEAAIAAFENEVARREAENGNAVPLRQSAEVKALRRLRQSKLPEPQGLPPELAAKIESVAAVTQERGRLQAEFEAAFARSLEQQSAKLMALARDPRLQEAVIWQNRGAFENAIQSLGKEKNAAAQRNQRQREHEQLLANYLQRYCMKNDSIGFFGPVAWSRMEEGKLVQFQPGPALLRRRRTYFEDWAVDKLAAGLSQTAGMDWWAAPRLSPLARIENGWLHIAGDAPRQMPALTAAVLALCDGQHLPADILDALRKQPAFQGIERDEITAILKQAAEQGVLFWRFAVPVGANPETNLRRQLEQIGDQDLQDAALKKLERLETARQEVSHAAGNPARLNEKLQQLENVFEELAQAPAQRYQGMTYGGRTLVYEDCQRDVTFTLSPELLRPIVPAFSLLLRSVRWLMQSTSSAFLAIFQQVYTKLASESGSPSIDALTWWGNTLPQITDAPAVQAMESQFRQRWLEMLPVPAGVRLVHFDSEKLRAPVEQSFPEQAGYRVVRYYCPDLLLGAESPEALERGEVQYVLGEVHAARNTLLHTALVQQHPQPQDLQDAIAWDVSPRRFKIVNTRDGDPNPTRTTESVYSPDDFFLSSSLDGIPPEGFTAHPISQLVVRMEGAQLVAATRDGAQVFHILDAFADLLFSFLMNKASWARPGAYVPRIMLDKLVIHRETWRATVPEMAFAMEKEEHARFIGARRWLQMRGMPDMVFVKTPTEMKPFYIDMRSPVFVEILCKMVRRLAAGPQANGEFSFSEMLPDLNHAWLSDAQGQKYTSELRIAFVDVQSRDVKKNPERSEGSLSLP
jgi:hypothetical protein